MNHTTTNEPADIDLDNLEALAKDVEAATTSPKEAAAYDELYGALTVRKVRALIALARRAPAPVVDERALFEATMPSVHPRDRNMPDRSYNSPYLHIAWEVWQLARAQQPPAPVVAHDAPEAPASAQPDRGAAQGNECEHCEDGYVYDTGHTRRMPCRDCSPSPASQPASPEAAHAQQEAAPAEIETARLAVEHYGYSYADVPAFVAWERYRARESRVTGIPGFKAIPAFVNGFNAGRAVPTTVPDHSEREAANAGALPTVAWLIEWKTAAGGDRRMVALHNFAADVRAEHGNATVTELVPRAPATIAAGQEAANAKDAARLDWLQHQCFDVLYPGAPYATWQARGGRMSENGSDGHLAFREAIDAAMAAVGAAGQEGGDK